MKKHKFVIYAAVLMLIVNVSFTGCSDSLKNSDTYLIADALCEAVKEVSGRGIIMFDRTRNYENVENRVLTEEKLGYLYTGRFDPLPCADRVIRYAVRLPSDMGGCEIHVIECADAYDCKEIAVYMQMRIDRFCSSEVLLIAPETHETCFKGAEVYLKGRFAFLIATPDNGAVKKEIERLL